MQADSLPAKPLGNPKNTAVVAYPFSRGFLPNLGTELGSPALQADSLRAKLPGKHCNHETLPQLFLTKKAKGIVKLTDKMLPIIRTTVRNYIT